jgi:hypothetical protein
MRRPDNGFAIALIVMAITFTALLAALFVHNLPNWCAHPERPGNWMVVPLCTTGEYL